MKRTILFLFFFILGISPVVISAHITKPDKCEEKEIFSFQKVLSGLSTPDVKRVDNFKLKDYNEKEFSLSDFKDSKAIVLIFVSTQCPVSNAYNERMEKLYRDFKDKNVVFLGINSNKEETTDKIKKHAEEKGLTFPILKDSQNKIADKLEASFTPEVFVLSKDREIIYHGRIDDSRREDEVKTQDLKNTLNEIIKGKEVSVKSTKAFGCTIKRVEC
jgi:peroxiredoxin